MKQDLLAYYHERAREYDKVYSNPSEQKDLLEATRIFQHLFSNKTVLEFACGTGYWTERIGETAQSVYATDINERVLEIADEKRRLDNIHYAVADMYQFHCDDKYDGFFGGFIWSHIPLQKLHNFLRQLGALIKPHGRFAFMDSNPVKDSFHDEKNIAETDRHGNTYQVRELENGNQYLVLKNFPTQDFLHHILSIIADQINIVQLEYYWIAYGELKPR